ncbi:MAG: roadblock/LC7 domain-containing protein [Anaerolineales bacterium]
MLNQILLIDTTTTLSAFLKSSLEAEGYEVLWASSTVEGRSLLEHQPIHLVLLNGVEESPTWLEAAAALEWTAPLICLQGREAPPLTAGIPCQTLAAPFSFQDLLLIVQDLLYQRTLQGRRPFQISPRLAESMDRLLQQLREDLRARCAVVSSSGGRLITSVGNIDRGAAITLAALMSGSFSASARAAQIFGEEEMFDSSLQETEGYGLYAIRLHDSLILSVVFSGAVTVGMVRHYAAQAAVDILELLFSEAGAAESLEGLEIGANFRESVNRVLGDILGE